MLLNWTEEGEGFIPQKSEVSQFISCAIVTIESDTNNWYLIILSYNWYLFTA